ncbi:MAG: hypothetical protein ACKVE4_02150 [Dissulfuribacterales bacterium]
MPRLYVSDPEEIAKFPEAIAQKHSEKNFSKDGVERQISWKIGLISSIESFLLSNWDINGDGLAEQDIVHLAEETLAYDGALLIGALSEFVELVEQEKTSELVSRLQLFQKQLKYGLPTKATIVLYELGFSDRVVALDLASSLGFIAVQKKDIINALKGNKDKAHSVIEQYPNYFLERFEEIMNA